MRCKVCGSADIMPIWIDAPPEPDLGGPWHRCLYCGSDSSEMTYADTAHRYHPGYGGRFGADVDLSNLIAQQTTNVAWFERFRAGVPDDTFLDIGCCEGAGLHAYSRAGWSVHGFDVMPHVASLGSHVTIASVFRADLFPRQYSAIQCREVIEHVEDWRGLLHETRSALLPGGLLQVQTPRPWHVPDPLPYNPDHLHLFSPVALRIALQTGGFTILDKLIWDRGQMWMCRREYL